MVAPGEDGDDVIIRVTPFRLLRVHFGKYSAHGFHFIRDPTTGPRWGSRYVWYVYDDHDPFAPDLPMWFRGQHCFRSLVEAKRAFVRGWFGAPTISALAARSMRLNLPTLVAKTETT